MHTPETMAKEAGISVAMLRMAAGLSHKTLAETSGVSMAELRNIERGDFDYFGSDEQSPIFKICLSLGVTVASLLRGNDDGTIEVVF